jgi:deoxyribonuclease-4
LEVGFNSGLPALFPPKIKALCDELRIRVNLHLPFFFGWSDQNKIDQSARYLRDGARLASEVRGVAVFHLGYAGNNRGFEDVRRIISSKIEETIESMTPLNLDSQFSLGIETSGRRTELGSLDDVITLVSDLSSSAVIPIVDWSHLYARTNGRFPCTASDFRQVISELERVSTREFYFHGSGIEFSNFQERRHLSAKTCTPPLPHLLKVLAEGGYDYTLIVESPTAVEDVLWLKEVSKDPSALIHFAEKKLRES